MPINLINYQATSEHYYQRTESVRVAGLRLSQDQLRQQVAQTAEREMPDLGAELAVYSNSASPVQASTNAPELQSIVDATTRLRALILSSITGTQMALLAESKQAEETQTELSLKLTHKVVFSDAEDGQPDLLDSIARNAMLVIDEREASSVSLAVKMTLNGKQINGELKVQQSRETHLEIRASAERLQKFLDPLMLNFSGPVQLAEGDTLFDLNVDGELDTLPSVISDSYLLVRDISGNGVIDNGVEVVGAMNGNGYAELRALDGNGDGFLSAEDTAFQSFSLWRPGQEGVGFSLDAKGVQAIYLSAIDSPFTLQQSRSGALLGQVRLSSFFVVDDQIKLSQQVDFIV